MERHSEWLQQMHSIVCGQHELVPFLRELQSPARMKFRPLPDAMLAQLQTSPDWHVPEANRPTLMMLETDDDGAGLMVVGALDGCLFVLAPA